MARLATCGAEIDLTGSSPDTGSITGTVTRDTTLFRSGLASYKCDSTGSNQQALFSVPSSTSIFGTPFASAASITGYARAYMNFSAAPGSSTNVLRLLVSGATTSGGISARLTSGGKLQLWNNVASTQIGSDSATTLGTDGSTWYRIELKAVTNGSSQITSCELQLDGVSVATGSALTLATGTQVMAGWAAAPGASKVC